MKRSVYLGVAHAPDFWLISILAMLLVLGLIMVYSASTDAARSLGKETTYYLKRQIIWLVLGVMAMIILSRIDYRAWQPWPIPGLVLLVPLAMLAGLWVANLGREKEYAIRWLLGASIQPSELAKLAIIIYMAAWLSSKGEKIKHLTYGLVPFGILLGITTGLIILQPNISTSLLIALTALIMFFVAGADIKQLLLLCVLGAAIVAPVVSQNSYVADRVREFLNAYRNPFGDPNGLGFQTYYSIAALVSGGITGRGLGNSEVKARIGGASHTDLILAIAGEELGLIGTLLVLGLFFALAYRGFRIAVEAPDSFGCLIAVGVTSWATLQAIIHAAVIGKLMPITGMPLPFISYGGSALVTSLAGMGLLISISRYTEKDIGSEHAYLAFGRRDGRSHLSRAQHS